MKRRALLRIGLALVLGLAVPAAATQAPAGDDVQDVTTTAEPEERDRLMRRYDSALRKKDAAELKTVLGEMAAFDNRELMAPALDALRYRASSVDKKAAKAEAEELGLKGKKELTKLVHERVAAVQAAGARLAANFPGEKKAQSALLKAFKDKALRKERPSAFAAVILALGRTGQRKVEQDVFREFRQFGNADILRATVRYFGRIRTKDLSIVRALCEELSSPEPANANSPTNPPASYWEERWKAWNAIRRDVSWALKEITGQVFQPAEGQHPSDEKKALDYVEEHKDELGLK